MEVLRSHWPAIEKRLLERQQRRLKRRETAEYGVLAEALRGQPAEPTVPAAKPTDIQPATDSSAGRATGAHSDGETARWPPGASEGAADAAAGALRQRHAGRSLLLALPSLGARVRLRALGAVANGAGEGAANAERAGAVAADSRRIRAALLVDRKR